MIDMDPLLASIPTWQITMGVYTGTTLQEYLKAV